MSDSISLLDSSFTPSRRSLDKATEFGASSVWFDDRFEDDEDDVDGVRLALSASWSFSFEFVSASRWFELSLYCRFCK